MSASMTSETKFATTPIEPKPRVKTCAMGLIKSTSSGRTKARTELVPSMNISAITGAAMRTERPMLRAGAFDSPASIATYSKPVSAPSANLL